MNAWLITAAAGEYIYIIRYELRSGETKTIETYQDPIYEISEAEYLACLEVLQNLDSITGAQDAPDSINQIFDTTK